MTLDEAADRITALIDGLEHSCPQGRLDAEALRLVLDLPSLASRRLPVRDQEEQRKAISGTDQ